MILNIVMSVEPISLLNLMLIMLKNIKTGSYGGSGFDSSIDDLGVDSRKIIIIGYIVAILFGWGGILLNLLLGAIGSFGFFGFVGFVFPGFLLNSSNPSIRKHAYIQMFIMLVGFALTLYMMFRSFL